MYCWVGCGNWFDGLFVVDGGWVELWVEIMVWDWDVVGVGFVVVVGWWIGGRDDIGGMWIDYWFF